MVIVTRTPVASLTTYATALGSLFFPGESGFGSEDIRTDINNDLNTFLDPVQFPVRYAWWNLNVAIDDFEPGAVDALIGFPIRRKFGTVTHRSVNTQNSFGFINYEQQSFPVQACLVRRDDYPGTLLRPADAPATPTIVDFIFPVISNVSGIIGAQIPNSLTRGEEGLYGNTGFQYYLPPTVVASLSVSYYALAYQPGSSAGGVAIRDI